LGVELATLRCKKSLVKKAQETAGQTTLRRHCNVIRTNGIWLFSWNVLFVFRPGSLTMLTVALSDYKSDITKEKKWRNYENNNARKTGREEEER
jgi:hypothetical protein